MSILCIINCIHFTLQQSSCQFSGNGKGAQMSGVITISKGSEEDLQTAVAYIGPVAVAVDASNRGFRVGCHV